MANTFKLKTKASVGITTTSVYVVPSSTTTVVIGITASNVSGNNINVGIGITRASADDVHVMKNVPIPQGSSFEFMAGNKIVLETTDTITAKSDVASSLDVALTIMEITLMALTKVTGSVIKDSVSLSGNVSVGGTLTYQDVTNVDALGIGTFRTGIKVLAGQVDVGNNIKLGNAGVITATSFSGAVSGTTGSFSGQVNVGSNIKLGTAGVVTATSFSGSGANLTGISQVGGATGADFNDNIKIRFGASNDLQLFHATAGISTIMHFHSGGEPLHITSNGDIKFKVAADKTGGGGEDGLII